MKYFIFVLLFAITTILTAEELVKEVMLQINTKTKLPEVFKGSVESVLTKNGFRIVSKEAQDLTLKEQAEQRKCNMYDESCVVNTGKMMAAKGIVLIEVTKEQEKSYLFKAMFIDVETGAKIKTEINYFENTIESKNNKELLEFGKKLINNLLGIETETTNSGDTNTKESSKITETTEVKQKQEKKYKIEFITTPKGVEVLDENNGILGTTPFSVNLTSGFQKIKFEKEGYETTEKEIHVKQNEKITVKLNEKIYELKIESNVTGAKIYINNVITGKTPFVTKLKEGIYKIKAEKEEYENYEEEISLKKDVEKSITLEKLYVEVSIESNITGAKVYINDTVKGKTPYTAKLKKGSYKIKVSQNGYENKEEVVKISDNETITIDIFEKGKGEREKMVKIPNKDFKMDVTEVTNKEYEKCVSAGKCEKQHYTGGKCWVYDGSDWKKGNVTSEFKEDKKPAVCVDFQQAKNYCEWLGKRLPTEEEWEYAIKGGESYKYSGSDNANEVSWYKDNSDMKMHEVATKKANKYGLFDMSGNVWEWTNSWYNSLNEYRVLRGGGFGDSEANIRVDYRSYDSPTSISYDGGFRCVQSLK